MTDTISQGAANQAGARINADAYAEAQDFLPLKGIDHVEFTVAGQLVGTDSTAPYAISWDSTTVTASEVGVAARAAASGSALALSGISLAFGGVAALTDVGFTVRRGDIRSIIGPNGAGKSSLINVISGVYRPDRGHVQLDGTSYAQVPTQRLAHLGVARTFQNLALFKGLSVLDNVASGLVYKVRSNFAGQVLGIGRSRGELRDIGRGGRVENLVVVLVLLDDHEDMVVARDALPAGRERRNG